MKMTKALLSGLFLTLLSFSMHAQCPTGEVEVTIHISTDQYGYEIYWELLPNSNTCGSGTIFAGGNPAVGCNGAGAQNQNPGGYGNNQTYMEGPWCLTENAQFDILYIDDWGDGGFDAEVFVDGTSIAQFSGGSGDPAEIFTFTAAPPAARDMTVTRISAPIYTFEGETVPIKGVVKSLGADPVTSFDLNYSINSGATNTQNISGVSITAGGEYGFEHSTPWTSPSTGTFSLDVWASNINGQPDLVPGNDHLSENLIVSSAIPNIIDDYLLMNPTTEVIATSSSNINIPRDLDFHPEMARRELWVINKDTENSGGSTVTFFNVGTSSQTHQWKRDGNAWHFMSLPTGIAMGDNGLWANSPGVFDANHNGPPPFTGPALWESDMSIYAEPSGGNGSHMDMLHESPYSQGIAHESANAYWVVDGYSSEVVRYDFGEHHGPGNSYHGDGRVRRYGEFTVTKDPGNHIVSHCVLDKQSGLLYVVDHGGQRVVRMDINTGVPGGAPTYASGESLAEHVMVTGYTWDVIINSGLQDPAGIDVIQDRLLVSDHATGEIIVFDISDPNNTPELGRIQASTTGIMGIKIGPDGLIWAVNADTEELIRVHPGPVGIDELNGTGLSVHPNPTSNLLFITGMPNGPKNIIIQDLNGRVVMQVSDYSGGSIDVSELANGAYTVQLAGPDGVSVSQQFVVVR